MKKENITLISGSLSQFLSSYWLQMTKSVLSLGKDKHTSLFIRSISDEKIWALTLMPAVNVLKPFWQCFSWWKSSSACYWHVLLQTNTLAYWLGMLLMKKKFHNINVRYHCHSFLAVYCLQISKNVLSSAREIHTSLLLRSISDEKICILTLMSAVDVMKLFGNVSPHE